MVPFGSSRVASDPGFEGSVVVEGLLFIRFYYAVLALQSLQMEKLVHVLGRVLLAGIVLLAVAVVCSTMKGYVSWYFRVDGRVIVDGKRTSGYMHANTERTVLLITRTDGKRPETYLVSAKEGPPMTDCGEWHPVRFLPFPVRQAGPPCAAAAADPATVTDAPVAAGQVRSRRSIEFSTVSGRRVKAEW